MIDNPTIDTSLGEVIDDLYAGTLDDAVWDRALIGIADRVRASATLLLAFNPSSGALLREECHRLSPSVLNDYRDHWTFHDARREPFSASPVGCPTTEQLLSIPNWQRTPILNEYLIPVDAPHFMPVWLRKSDSCAVVLSLQGTRKRGPFDARDIERFRQVLPHVNRALQIRDRLEAANLRANSLASGLHRVNFGVLVLSAQGKILEANAAAEHLLSRENALRGTTDRALVLHQLSGPALWRYLHGSCHDGRQERLVRIERGPGRSPISVMVTALPEAPVRWLSSEPSCLVFLFDPESQITPRLTLLMQELGISARESQIAVLLAMGLNLPEVARRLRISIHTGRTHLKAIFAKTGIRSQAELIRRAVTGPAASAAQPSPPP